MANRILLSTMAPGLIAALLLGGGLTSLYLYQLNTLLQDRASLAGRQLSQLIAPAVEQHKNTLLRQQLDAALEQADIRAVEVFDRNGRTLVQAGPQIPLPPQARAQPAAYAGRGLSSAAGLYHISPVAGGAAPPAAWLAVEISTSGFTLMAYRGIVLALVCTLIVLLAAVLVARRLVRRFVMPLERLGQAVKRLSEGDMQARVEAAEAGQCSELAADVNKMAVTLAQSQRQLQRDIDQSTDDLRQTLETVEIQNIELDLARKQALQASRIKSAFLANTSYEIRTPLNVIIGFSNLLLKSGLNGRQREYARTIENASQGLLAVISDILDFSRIEAGKLELDHIPLQLPQVIDQALQILAPAACKKQLQLVSLIDRNAPLQLLGDPLRLKQILTNLISNAIKFSSGGNIVVRAGEQARCGDCVTLKFSVSDSGVGLSKAQQSQLFDTFSRADVCNRGAQGGTGLGLAVSRGLAERMGGDIGVSSEPGEGATFWFTAQLQIDRTAAADIDADALQNRRVAIFESNAMVQLQLSHYLESWQVRALQIDRFDDILVQIRRQNSGPDPVEVLLLDADSDAMPAVETLRGLVAQLERHFNCQTLVLAQPTHQPQLAQALQHTGARFSGKPLGQNDLYRNLAAQLGVEVGVATDPAATAIDLPRGGTAPRVLVVDDNPANLQLVGEMLADLQVETRLAASGSEAIEHCTTQRFDLIFMDIQMPGMDGLETSRRLRRAEAGGHTPIVALTAHALDQQRSQLLLSGLDDYLSKPATEAQLAQIIERWVTAPGRARSDHPQPLLRRPLVDIDESLRLSNGKSALAKDMLKMLVNSLPGSLSAVTTAARSADYARLEALVHQLHGGCCYCGVPRLKRSSKVLETSLQNGDYDRVQALVEDLQAEIKSLLSWVETQNLETVFEQTGSAH